MGGFGIPGTGSEGSTYIPPIGGTNSTGAEFQFTPAILAHFGIAKTDPAYNALLKMGSLTVDIPNKAGILVATVPSTGTAFALALAQIVAANHAYASAVSKIFSKLGIPPAPNRQDTKAWTAYTKALDSVWTNLEATKGEWQNTTPYVGLPGGGTSSTKKPPSTVQLQNAYNQAQINNQNYWNEKNYALSQQLGYAQISAGTSQATAAQQSNAIDNVANYLDSWGLGIDANILTQIVTHEGDHITNTEGLLNILRGRAPSGLGPQVDATLRRNYENAFPGLVQYNKTSPRPMNESQYQAVVQGYTDTAAKYGLPHGFLTKNEIEQLVGGDVSVAEFDSRIQNGYLAAKNADATTKQILQQQYGIGGGHLLAYFLDPKRGQAAMEQAVAKATLQGYAKESGVPQFSGLQAQQLLDATKSSTLQATGLGDPYALANIASAKRGIDVAAAGQSLINNAPGAQAPHIDTNTLIGSVIPGFGGKTQTADESAVTTAKQEAIAPFAGGGGFGQSSKGTDVGYAKQ